MNQEKLEQLLSLLNTYPQLKNLSVEDLDKLYRVRDLVLEDLSVLSLKLSNI
jgi:hypothetical protein